MPAVPDPNPLTLIVAELNTRLSARPFVPFAIVMSDGERIEVPSRDHCFITPLLRRIEVEHDDGRIFDVNPLHVTRLERLRPAA